MKKPSAKALRARWLDKPDLHYITHLETKTKNLTESPFGIFEGRQDFRYLPFTPLIEFENLAIENTDFTGAEIKSIRFSNSHFSDCIFDKAELNDVTFMDNCSLVRLSFKASKITNCSHIGGTIRDCLFVDTKWQGRYNSFAMTKVIGCLFEGGAKTLRLIGAILEHCAFKGDFYDLQLSGWSDILNSRLQKMGDEHVWMDTPFEMVHNKMEGVDFSEATLRLTHLTDFCYLHRICIPSKETHCVYINSQETYEAIIVAIAQNFDIEESAKMTGCIDMLYRPHSTVPHKLVHIDNFEKFLSIDQRQTLFKLMCKVTEKIEARIKGVEKK